MKKILFTTIAIIGLFVRVNAQCPTPSIILTLPDTTIAFKQDSIMLDGGAGFTSYSWSTGAMTRYIWIKNNSKINLTVTNSLAACGKDSTVVLFVKGIQQKDTSICAGKSLNLYTPSSGSIIPNNGLVAWYPFNGNANDASGNGNNGINNGASITSDRFGNTNSSYYFNGSSSYINVPNLNNLQYKPITISLWYNFASLCALSSNDCWKMLIGRDQSGNTSEGNIAVLNHSNSSISNKMLYYTGGGLNFTNFSPITNSWTNLTFTYDNNSLTKYYINGNLIYSDSFVYSSSSSIPFNIGSGGNRFFYNGNLDDIAIYNRAITTQEVQLIYGGTNTKTKITWSTNDTTNSILVTPNTSITYRCTQGIGSFTMIDSVRVTVNALPNINSLPDTTIAFKQDSLLLNAGVGYSKYVWSRGDTTQSIWVKTAGINKVTVFNSSGCSNSDSTKVLFVKGILNKDSSVCQNTFVNLKTLNQVNAKYLWSTGDTISNINNQIVSDNVIKCTYQIGSFVKQDSVKLTVRYLPSKTITYNIKGLCKNDTISINASTGYAYNWYKNNNIIGGANNTLKAFAYGNYKAKLIDSTGCSTISDSVILFNAPLPIVKMSLVDTALCLNGNVFKYTDSTTLDSGSFNRIWSFGNGNTSTLSTSNQSYATAGNYISKLKVTTNYGCADSTIKNITVKPNPLAGVMLGQVINLNPSTPYIYTVSQQPNHIYNWVITNGIVALGQSTNAATVQWIKNGDGYLKVEVTNPQGCLDTTAVATKIGNVGINETSTINNLTLFPNPNHGSFTVGFTLKESSATKLELINMLGQQVWLSNMQLQNGEQLIPINLSISAGVYVLKITTSTGEITKQVLVK